MSPETLARRVEVALVRLDYALPSLAEWRDVSARYGIDSNPARGCLLALVRDAWGDPTIYIVATGASRRVDGDWRFGWMPFSGHPLSKLHKAISETTETELDALVSALEAAPRKCPGCDATLKAGESGECSVCEARRATREAAP
jgi:hypothetical protein